MTHYTEDELILHYYGEDRARPDVERHLAACDECAAAYHSMAETLELVVAPEVPERDESYALDVWTRIRARLPERPRHGGTPGSDGTAMAAAVPLPPWSSRRSWPAGCGRDRFQQPPRPCLVDRRCGRASASDWPPSAITWSDRSGCCSISSMPTATAWTCRPSRRGRPISSTRTGCIATPRRRPSDSLVAGVLDELERSLLEVVHGPSTPTPAEFEAVRTRLDAAPFCSRFACSPMSFTSEKSRPFNPGKRHERSDAANTSCGSPSPECCQQPRPPRHSPCTSAGAAGAPRGGCLRHLRPAPPRRRSCRPRHSRRSRRSAAAAVERLQFRLQRRPGFQRSERRRSTSTLTQSASRRARWPGRRPSPRERSPSTSRSSDAESRRTRPVRFFSRGRDQRSPGRCTVQPGAPVDRPGAVRARHRTAGSADESGRQHPD